MTQKPTSLTRINAGSVVPCTRDVTTEHGIFDKIDTIKTEVCLNSEKVTLIVLTFMTCLRSNTFL